MESSWGGVVWSQPGDAGDWRRFPFPFRPTAKYIAFFLLQSNHGVLLREMLQRCFSLEQEWVMVCTIRWHCQPASAIPHSFCFLGMIISCWHSECVFWGKKIGHLLFLEWVFYASYWGKLSTQSPGNVWSPDPKLHCSHVTCIPVPNKEHDFQLLSSTFSWDKQRTNY